MQLNFCRSKQFGPAQNCFGPAEGQGNNLKLAFTYFHEFFFVFFKGRMYNKEAIIEKLLNAKSEGTSGERDYVADHIRSLKDVIELQLEQNPAFKGNET